MGREPPAPLIRSEEKGPAPVEVQPRGSILKGRRAFLRLSSLRGSRGFVWRTSAFGETVTAKSRPPPFPDNGVSDEPQAFPARCGARSRLGAAADDRRRARHRGGGRDRRRGDPARPSDADGGKSRPGDVEIVAFMDYNCPFCKKSSPDLERFVDDDGKVRLIYKDWPILTDASVYRRPSRAGGEIPGQVSRSACRDDEHSRPEDRRREPARSGRRAPESTWPCSTPT